MNQPTETPARHYLLLDRTDAGRPVWQVVRVIATATAHLDATGHYDPAEWSDVVFLATITLGAVVRLPYVPAPLVFRVREVEQ